LQNKANVKMGKMTISTATTKAYAKKQRTMNNERYSKQSQSKPIKPNSPTVRLLPSRFRLRGRGESCQDKSSHSRYDSHHEL
jgi:hypothetical protein